MLREVIVDARPIINRKIDDLNERIRVFFDTAGVFHANLDEHGMHDMGVEIAALKRSRDVLDAIIMEIDGVPTTVTV